MKTIVEERESKKPLKTDTFDSPLFIHSVADHHALHTRPSIQQRHSPFALADSPYRLYGITVNFHQLPASLAPVAYSSMPVTSYKWYPRAGMQLHGRALGLIPHIIASKKQTKWALFSQTLTKVSSV